MLLQHAPAVPSPLLMRPCTLASHGGERRAREASVPCPPHHTGDRPVLARRAALRPSRCG
eukprot:3610745-Pyramimonas_sp.AAC.1